MAKYKAVIFDFDDTLVESRAMKWAQHKHVAKKFYDIDLTDDILYKHWGKALHILIAELYQNRDTSENLFSALRSTEDDFLKKIYDGSIDTVEKLYNQGLKIGILSSTNNEFLLRSLNRLNFPVGSFILIQGSDDSTVHKPDPLVFLPALEKLKNYEIEKRDIVYIGDSLDDLEAATGAGVDFIAVTTGLYTHDDFQKKGAKIIIKNIREVLENI